MKQDDEVNIYSNAYASQMQQIKNAAKERQTNLKNIQVPTTSQLKSQKRHRDSMVAEIFAAKK